MTKTVHSLAVSMSLMAALLSAGISHAEIKPAGPDWYLVDEIIEDEAPDYRSDVFFADKASIKRDNGYTSLSISQIIMAQVENDGTSQSNIKDVRSRILIDCNQHTYAAMEISEFDQENKLITSKTNTRETAEWILPFANSGYVSIFRFVCEPDIKFGTQKFPGHVQPLASVMAYLNADWSN